MTLSMVRIGEALHHLVRRPPVSSPLRPAGAREREFLNRVHQVAEEHLADPFFTTTDAAACLLMSRMHLNRRLRKLTGQSTHQFIHERRLECARTILLTQPLPVAAVAAQAGFMSLSHFSKAFRLRYGVPPAAYRRQNPIAPPLPPSSS